jgi:predicted phage tail component-like protein
MGFKFNTKHSDEFQIAVRTTQIPYIPEKKQKVVEVQGKDGEYIFEDGYKNIQINLSCSITADTLLERRKTARSITEWLSGGANSVLIFDYEPDVQYIVKKVVNGVNGIFRGAQVPIDDFDIIFECVPYQEQTFENSDLTWEEADSAWQYTELAWSEGATSFEGADSATFDVTLQNYGTYKALPIILLIVTKTVGTPSVTITRKDEPTNTFTLTLAGTTYIDSEEQIVRSSGMVNKLQYYEGDFLEIRPGENIFTISGSYTTLFVDFDYKNTYL